MLVLRDGLRIPLRELRFDFARSGGPGGQKVNKTSSKAVLRWSVASSPSLPEEVRERFLERHRRRISREGELILTSTRFRDRGRNVADCVEKLRAMLETAARAPRPRKPTRPSRASKERRLEHKRRVSATKSLRRRPQGRGDAT